MRSPRTAVSRGLVGSRRKTLSLQASGIVITLGCMTIAKEDYEWYRSAVFYEVLVRAFFDSDNNGSGAVSYTHLTLPTTPYV